MATPTNLTESISKLRERDKSFFRAGLYFPKTSNGSQIKIRKTAKDYFMLFTYGLFTVALVAQITLIVWLDLL